MAKTGRPEKIRAGAVEQLLAIVHSDPTATLEEIRVELQRRSTSRRSRQRQAGKGLFVCRVTKRWS